MPPHHVPRSTFRTSPIPVIKIISIIPDFAFVIKISQYILQWSSSVSVECPSRTNGVIPFARCCFREVFNVSVKKREEGLGVTLFKINYIYRHVHYSKEFRRDENCEGMICYENNHNTIFPD
jgi:hypothetical protein